MDEIDMKETNSWLQLRLTSHLEGYINAIQEQRTQYEGNKKVKRSGKEKADGYNLQSMRRKRRIRLPPYMQLPNFSTYVISYSKTTKWRGSCIKK